MSSQVRHPVFARWVARVAAKAEGTEEDDLRRELLAGLSGRVIEIGSGTGPNFPFYPQSVSELVAVEPEDYLRAKAVDAASSSGHRISVVDAVADDLPFEDGYFDAAVAALVLCSVPSQPAALAELRRVVLPGGELRFYEHVVARSQPLSALQHALAPVTQRLAGGCRPDHDTERTIEAAGFHVERCRRLVQRSLADALGAPRILGTARRR